MATKTNVTINGNEYYQLRRKVGMKKNKAGKWVADYRLFYGKSKKEALSKYEEYKKTISLDAKKPFGEIADWYIANIFSISSQLSGNTKTLYINGYKSVFENSKVAGQRLKDVTGEDLQDVISSATVKAATVHQSVKFIRRFYKYLESQKIATDVTSNLELPAIQRKKQDQSIDTFTDAELKKFIYDTPKDHRLRLLIILAICTGARLGELLALQYSDIQGNQVFISKALQEISPVRGSNNKTELVVGKTKTRHSVRSVPIDEKAAAAVADHAAWHKAEMKQNGYESDFLFTTSSGQLYFKSTIRKAYTRLCKSLGIDQKGFHTFRHTFGSRLAANGVPLHDVSKLLGHDSETTTYKYYLNIEDKIKREAINALNVW